jgi:hypothetical protein
MMNSRTICLKAQVKIERIICGLHLRTIVGLERCTIKYLVLDAESAGKEYIDLLARYVSPTLISLDLACGGLESVECYEVLEIFFDRCDGIRNLRLEYFDFGNDPDSVSQTVREGFGRLSQLDVPLL